ncbi:MAG: hypothetical protein LBD53_05975 [Tannerella sp.]|jgi:hypothetical protein|nr:hypothetical protein [Tannerella sp.]
MNRIEFYRCRDFSGKMNATFDFIRENARPLFKYIFFFIFPVCLLQTFMMNSIYGSAIISIFTLGNTDYFGDSAASFFSNFGLLYLCYLVGTCILSGLIYAMMHTYATRENRLKDVVLEDFKRPLYQNIMRCIGMSLFMIFFVIVLSVFAGLLAATASVVSIWLSLILILGVIALIIPLTLVIPIYLFERQISFFGALIKAWQLGSATFWSMVGFIIVISLISSVIQTVMAVPWYVANIIKVVLTVPSGGVETNSVILKFAVFLSGIVQALGMYLSLSLTVIALAFQYFHAREKIEGVTIEENITKFDSL